MPTPPVAQWPFRHNIPPEIPLHNWQHLVDLIADLYKSSGAWLMQATETGIEALVVAKGAHSPFKPGDAITHETNVYCGHVIDTNQPLYVRNADRQDRWRDNPACKEFGFKSYLGVPLRWPDGTVFGTLCTMDTVATDYPEAYVALLGQFEYAIDSDLRHLVTTRKLNELSLEDDLTQLTNRRGFMELARQMVQLARRHDFYVSMTFFGLNGVKAITDRFGLRAKNRLLRTFARALKESTRMEDGLARMGDHEFAVLALQKRLPEAHLMENRVRQNFETLLGGDPQIPCPTFCFGTRTCAPAEPFSLDSLLLESEALMHEDMKRSKES